VTVRQATRPEASPVPGGVALTPGDFVLEAGGTRVVVGGMERGGAARGGILEMRAAGMAPDDGVALFGPRVHAGADVLRVTVTDMRIVARGDRPAVRLSGRARAPGGPIEVAREVTLRGDGGWLSMRTRLHNRGRQGLPEVATGLRAGWGGAVPFVAGLGELDRPGWQRASWMGREGDGVALALAFDGHPVVVRGSWEQHGEARFLSGTEIRTEPRRVEAGGSITWVAHLVTVRGNQAEAVRRLGWARGRPFREVHVQVPDAPGGARVEARTGTGEPVLRTAVGPDGQVLLPLPPLHEPVPEAGHVLIGTAPGHADGDPVALTADLRRAVVRVPRGGRLRVTVTDGDGVSMTGRVRILALDAGTAPDVEDDPGDSVAGDTVLAREGDAVVPLAPGRYRVLVTRGPEWTVADEEVRVTETFRPHVRARLARVVDPGDWVGCDFHLHAAPSYDSDVSLEDRVLSLLAEGVRFAVATDHNHVTDYGPTVEAMGIDGFGTVAGVEVSTWNPAFGHFNAYPYPMDPALPGNGRPTYQRTTPAALFQALRDAGDEVIVQVNHPRLEPNIGYFDRTGFDPRSGRVGDAHSDDYDVLEVFNGFDLARPAMVEQVFQDWLALLAGGRRVVANGSSDSHRVSFQWAGYPRTYVQVEGGDATDATGVLRSLRAGRAFVTSGPFLEAWVDGRGPGSVATVEGGVLPVRVRVRAAPWMEVDVVDLFVGSELLRTVPIPHQGERDPSGVLRFDQVVELAAPDADSFVVARVRGGQVLDTFFGREDVLPLAFTNPIFIDADGDGEVPW
jgi:hypothetical protein